VPQITSRIFSSKILGTSVSLISGINCERKTLASEGKLEAGTGNEKTAIFWFFLNWTQAAHFQLYQKGVFNASKKERGRSGLLAEVIKWSCVVGDDK
jgi:hypothetical protein